MLIKSDSIGLKKISKSVESVLTDPSYFSLLCSGLSFVRVWYYQIGSLGLVRLGQFWLGTHL